MNTEPMKYYVTAEGTATHNAILSLTWRKIRAYNAIRAFVKRVGGVGYRCSKMLAAGGIVTVEFADKPSPDVWQITGNPLFRQYRPVTHNSQGKALYDEMTRLSRVGHNELNAIVGYTDYFAGSRVEIEANLKMPGTEFGFIVSAWMVDTGRAKIPADCREVTEQEFNTLTGREIRLAAKQRRKNETNLRRRKV